MPDSVLEIIHGLSLTRSEDEIAEVVSQAVRTLLHADGATLALRDGDHFYYARGEAVSPLWKGRRLPMNGCIAGWCMTNGQIAASADIRRDSRMLAEIYRPAFVRSLAVAPVGAGAPIAALGAYWSEQHQPQPEELDRLQAIADGAGLAMANLHRANTGHPDASIPSSAPGERPVRDRVPLGPAIEGFLYRGLRPNSLQAYAFALGCVLVATMLALGLQAAGVSGLVGGAFFFPAVLLALLVGGSRSGAAAAAFGGVALYYFLMEPPWSFSPPTASDVIDLAIYAGSSALMVLTVRSYKRMVQNLKQEDARHLILALEQQHRAKNAVVVAEAIVRGGLETDPVQARIINQRIRAAFADVDIHLRSRRIRMPSLLNQELEPFDLARFDMTGDAETALIPEVSSIFTLAVHELATNALKYGALSVPDGRVELAWRIADGQATIFWRETGGPPVSRPEKTGYGTLLLGRLVRAAGGELVISFPATGATAQISLWLDGKRSPA